MIDRETVDRIYAAANIVDIIGEYVTLKRKGVNYVACCPFHNEKTPSFVVSPSKGLYKCFGCGKGGNAVTFVMDQEATTYAEALKMVAKRYGIEVKEEALTEEEVRRNDDRESMMVVSSYAADRFRDRVIFPVHNISGRIVAFGGRTLRTDKQVAKYQNSPESEIYSKKRELYGLYFAKKAIQQQDFAIMVEGYTDVISMHQAGVENVVSSSGTSLTTEQIRLLNRFTKNITVIYDGDSAGIHASLRGIDMILKEGMNVRVVLLPEPEDPDSFARSHTASELQEYIRANEQDFLEFKAKLLLQDAEGDPIRKAALIADMVQSVSVIPDPIQRSVYIKECARIMDIDEQILISEVARKRMTTSGDRETDEFLRRQTTLRQREAQQPGVEFVKQVEAGSSFETLEREIVKYLLKYGHCSFDFKEGRTMVACNVAEVIFSELSDDNIAFRNPVYNKIMAAYREQWAQLGTGVEVPAHVFLNHIDPEVCNMSVDILTSDDNYVASELWRRKEIHIDTDAEMLAVGVPKAVTLYKSKVIEALIKELQGRLGDENISDEEMRDVVQRLTAYNQVKVTIANKIQRLIL